ncbi:hypothetical protein ACVDG5_010715 [Mesorhizobium sp. ORM6]
MKYLFETVPLVTSGLSLLAFFIAAVAYIYRSTIQSVRQEVQAIDTPVRLRALEVAQKYIPVNLRDIPPERRAEVALEQLKLIAAKQKNNFIATLIFGFLFAAAAIVAMILSAQAGKTPPDPGPSPKKYLICISNPDSPPCPNGTDQLFSTDAFNKKFGLTWVGQQQSLWNTYCPKAPLPQKDVLDLHVAVVYDASGGSHGTTAVKVDCGL